MDKFYKLAAKYTTLDMKQDWNQYAETDPYYYSLRDPDKKGKWTEKEFYNSGVAHVENLLKKGKTLGLPKAKKLALDFGCGPGRFTEVLAKDFDKVIGFDISEKMIELAEERAEQEGIDNIEYIAADNLSSIKDNSVDLIMTRLTLEHIPPEQIKKYVKDFTRILKKGGLASFEIPFEEPKDYKKQKEKTINKGKKEGVPLTLIFAVPKNEIFEIIKNNGCQVIDSTDNGNVAGDDFEANFYYITK